MNENQTFFLWKFNCVIFRYVKGVFYIQQKSIKLSHTNILKILDVFVFCGTMIACIKNTKGGQLVLSRKDN